MVYLLKSPPWILKSAVSLGRGLTWEEGMGVHEILDDTMELGALVAESFRTNRQSPEVLGGLWDGLSLEYDG